MALDKDRLGIAVNAKLDVLFANPAVPPAALDVWKAIAEEIISEVVTFLEVNAIVVDVGSPLGTVLAAGIPVPNDGGAAVQIAQVAASPGQIATQNNDGVGHVA